MDANLYIPDGGELLLNIEVPRKEVRVDANGPAKVKRVYSTHADGSWGVGEEIHIFVEFTSAVEVVGAPSLVLRTGCHSSQCHTREIQRLRCQATAGKFSVAFAGEVVRNIPWDANQRMLGDYLTRMTQLNNVLVEYSISDSACMYFGNNITVTFESVNIDGADGDLPAMTADKNNGGGDGVNLFHIRFKPPTLTPTAWEIQKGNKAPDRIAAFAGQPSPQTLQFVYTVLPGDNATRLDYTSSDALALSLADVGRGTARIFNANSQQTVPVNAKLPPPGFPGDWERGIGSSLSASSALKIDVARPVVTDVTSPHADGTFGIGEVILIRVQFSQPIVVTGSPTLVLETGLVDRIIPFTQVVGESVAEFTYIVQSKDTSPDLAYAGTTVLELNGGSIKRKSTNPTTNAILTLPVNGERGSLSVNKNFVIDTSSPEVSSVVAVSPDGVYTAGDTVEIAVTLKAPVIVTGSPVLLLRTGQVDLFPGMFVQAAPVPNSPAPQRTIMFPSVNHGLSTAASKGLQFEINGQILTVESVNGDLVTMVEAYTGPVVRPTVVAAGGGPAIPIRTPGFRAAVYASGSGTQRLVFRYTVQIGDVSLDLDYTSTSALQTNGGSIKRLSTTPVTDADLTLATPGASKSLGLSSAIVINTDAPRIVQANPITRDGVYKAGDTIAFALVFDVPVVVLDAATVLMSVTEPERYSTFSGKGSGTTVLEFAFECGPNDQATVFDFADAKSLRASLGSIFGDIRRRAMAPMVPAVLDLPFTGLSSKGIAIDQDCAFITAVTTTHEDATVGVGEIIDVLVQYSASVNVNAAGGVPTLVLTTGKSAAYVSGSASQLLRFRYVVKSGDNTVRLNYDGIYALKLNGGTITASATNELASTVLPAPASSALMQQSAVFINTSPPTVQFVATKALDGVYTVGDTLTIFVKFSAPVDVAPAGANAGVPVLLLTAGVDNGVQARFVASEDDEVYFSFPVVAGQSTASLSYFSRTALKCSGSSGVNQDPAQAAVGASVTTLGTRVFVAWSEVSATSSKSQVRVRSFDAQQFPVTWDVEDGGNAAASSLQFDPTQDGTAPVLAALASKLYCAWQEVSTSASSPTQVRVAVYQGLVPSGVGVLQWLLVDQKPVTAAGVNRDAMQSAAAPTLTAHSSKLYAAWHEVSAATGVSQIRVAVFNGLDAAPAWTFVDGNAAARGINYAALGAAQNVRLASCTSIANSATMVLYAAWEEREATTNTQQVRVAALTGTDASPKWVFVDGNTAFGLNANTAMSATAPSLACMGTSLAVAWSEAALTAAGVSVLRIRAMQFNGNVASPRWKALDQSVGLNFDLAQSATSIRLRAQPVGGSAVLYATWEETSAVTGTSQVRVASFTGSLDKPSWTFLDGARSTSSLNHDSARSAVRPVLAVSPTLTFQLFAFWHEPLAAIGKTHVRGSGYLQSAAQWQSLHDSCVRRKSSSPTTVSNLLLPELDAPGALDFDRDIRIDTSAPVVHSVMFSGDIARVMSTALALQTVDVFNQASVTQGAYRLAYGAHHTSGCIDWDATPATGTSSLKAMLEAIPGLALRVSVTQDKTAFHDGSRYLVTFLFPTMGLQSLRVKDSDASDGCAAFECLPTATFPCSLRNIVRVNLNVDVTFRPGVLDALVRFSFPVVVATGTPMLALETGPVDATAMYTSRSALQEFDVGVDAPSRVERGSFRLSYGDFSGGGAGVGTIRTTECIDVPPIDEDGVQELQAKLERAIPELVTIGISAITRRRLRNGYRYTIWLRNSPDLLDLVPADATLCLPFAGRTQTIDISADSQILSGEYKIQFGDAGSACVPWNLRARGGSSAAQSSLQSVLSSGIVPGRVVPLQVTKDPSAYALGHRYYVSFLMLADAQENLVVVKGDPVCAAFTCDNGAGGAGPCTGLQLAVNVGYRARRAVSDMLSFRYLIQTTDNAQVLTYADPFTALTGDIVRASKTPSVRAALALPAPAPPLENALGAQVTIVSETAIATVLRVYAATRDGEYTVGDEIVLFVQFSGVVQVQGTPVLELNSGGVAEYFTGTNTDTLEFRYKVAADESTTSLNYATQHSLMIPTVLTHIRYSENGDAQSAVLDVDLLLPPLASPASLAAVSDIAIDTSTPTIVSVSSTNANTAVGEAGYGIGDVLLLTVEFSKEVTVLGTPPTLQVDASATAAATFTARGYHQLIDVGVHAAYPLTSGQFAVKYGATLSGCIDYNDAGSNTATSMRSRLLEIEAIQAIGLVSVTLRAVKNGHRFEIVFQSNQVTTIPLALEPVVSDVCAPLLPTSDSPEKLLAVATDTIVTFWYEIASDEASADLDVAGTSLVLASADSLILRRSRDPTLVADVTLPLVGTPGRLKATKDLVVAGSEVKVIDVIADSAGGTYGVAFPPTASPSTVFPGEILFRVVFSRAVRVVGSPRVELATGSLQPNGVFLPNRFATYVNQPQPNEVAFMYHILEGDFSSNLAFASVNALASAQIYGVSTSSSHLAKTLLPRLTVSGTSTIRIDANSVPTTVKVSSPHADGTFGAGEAIEIQVTFSKSVILQTGLNTNQDYFARHPTSLLFQDRIYVLWTEWEKLHVRTKSYLYLAVFSTSTLERIPTAAAPVAINRVPDTFIERASMAIWNNQIFAAWDESGFIYCAKYNGIAATIAWTLVPNMGTNKNMAMAASQPFLIVHNLILAMLWREMAVVDGSGGRQAGQIRIAVRNDDRDARLWIFHDGDRLSAGLNRDPACDARDPSAVIFKSVMFVTWSEARPNDAQVYDVVVAQRNIVNRDHSTWSYLSALASAQSPYSFISSYRPRLAVRRRGFEDSALLLTWHRDTVHENVTEVVSGVVSDGGWSASTTVATSVPYTLDGSLNALVTPQVDTQQLEFTACGDALYAVWIQDSRLQHSDHIQAAVLSPTGDIYSDWRSVFDSDDLNHNPTFDALDANLICSSTATAASNAAMGVFWTEFDGFTTKLRFRHQRAPRKSLSLPVGGWEEVTAGAPLLKMATGTTPPGYASFIDRSGIESYTLKFMYVTKPGESAVDLDVLDRSALVLNGATLRDYLGQTPDYTLFPRSNDMRALSYNNDINVDTTPPLVVDVAAATPSGEYGVGQLLQIQVVFSMRVTVSGTSAASVPVLYLRSDELHFLDERVNPATYVSGSGTSVLTFEYTTTELDYCEKLDYFSSSSLALLGDAAIRRTATFPTTSALLALPVPKSLHALSGNRAIAIKARQPQVTQVTATSADGTYHPGDTLTLQVVFSLPVIVIGAPILRLETGRSGASAQFVGGNKTTTLSFTYAIALGDQSARLDVVDDRNGNVRLNYVKALDLANRAEIFRLSTNPVTRAIVTVPAPGTPGSLSVANNIVVDSVRPSVIDVRSSSADGTYDVGDEIEVLVAFSRSVVVVGTPLIVLNVDASGNVRTAQYKSGSGTSELRFVYRPFKGDATQNVPLDVRDEKAFILRPLLGGREITLPAARVLCTADVPSLVADVTLPRPGVPMQANSVKSLVGNSKKIFVRTDGFRVKDIQTDLVSGETYSPGQRIRLLVVFTGPAIVQGSPQLRLNVVAATPAYASYTQGSGTRVLQFEYVVAVGDSCKVLDAASMTALELNGGVITDASGVYVPLRLSAAFAPGSLSFNARIEIASTPPTVTRVYAVSPNGTYGVGDDVLVAVAFSRRVTFLSGLLAPPPAPMLSLQLSAGARVATYASGDGSREFVFKVRIQPGDASQRLTYTSQTALTGTLFALATTSLVQANTQLPPPVTSVLSLWQQSSIQVDSTPPTVLRVTAISLNGTYGLGDALRLRVHFSYRVDVSAPVPGCGLELSLGNSVVRTARYTGGSTSKELEFAYTVTAGDRTGRLDYVAQSSLRCTILQHSALPSLVASNTLPLPGSDGSLSDTSDLRIDATAPRVTSVSSPLENGVYGASQVVDITVSFSEAVRFTSGQPRLRLAVASAGRATSTVLASYVTGVGTSTLTFRYTTREGDMALPLTYDGIDALTMDTPSERIFAAANGGPSYRVASLRLPVPMATASLSNNRDIRIDTSEPPRVVNVGTLTPDGVYTAGDVLQLTVCFTTPVVVTGAPTLALETGRAQPGIALYVRGSGTPTLVFTYTVQRGDRADRLDYRRCPDTERRDPDEREWTKLVICSATANALQLGLGGSIKRLATTPSTDATLDLPEVSSWPKLRFHTSRDDYVYVDQVESATDIPAAERVEPRPSLATASEWRNPRSVSVVYTSSSVIVRSTGVPDGAYGPFPNIYNPHTVRAQNYVFAFPRQPTVQPTATALVLDAPIGVMLNGVPFFASRSNVYGSNVMSSSSRALLLLDKCNGLVDAGGDYRYYASPDCLLRELGADVRNKLSPLIGYAFDGFPLYGPYNEDGALPADLDECNGRIGYDGTYRYHVTSTAPYLLGCFRGRPSVGTPLPERLYRSISYSHSLRINTEPPRALQVYTSKDASTFVAGETLDIVVQWSSPVAVDVTNSVPSVAVANSTHVALFDAAKSTPLTSVFIYTVTGDVGPFNFDYRTAIQLNGATIRRLAATPTLDADVRLVNAEHTPRFASKHQLVQNVAVQLRGLYHPQASDLRVRLFHETKSAVVFAHCCAPTDAFGRPDPALRVSRAQLEAYPVNPTSGVGYDYSFQDLTGATNLAADGRATALQSSTSGACVASNAIDGRIDGYATSQTVARTDAKRNQTAWWELRLLQNTEIGTVRLWMAREDLLPAVVQRIRVDTIGGQSAVDGSFTLVFTAADGSEHTTAAVHYNAVAMIADEDAKIENLGIGKAESLQAKLAALPGMPRVFITRFPADAALSQNGAFTWSITFLDNPRLYDGRTLPLRVGLNAICGGTGVVELSTPFPGDDVDRWNYLERDEREDSVRTGKLSMFPLWIMLFEDTAVMDFESFRDAYDAAIWVHRVESSLTLQQRRLVSVNPPPNTKARYVRVIAERPFARLTLAEVEVFKERSHLLSEYESGTPVSTKFYPGAETWSPEEPFQDAFGSMVSEGTWTLAIQDAHAKEQVGEYALHGEGAISDWVLTVTDMAGNAHTYFMDVRAHVKTLPRHGKLYVGIHEAEADHLDSDRNGILDSSEADAFLVRYLLSYEVLSALTRKRALENFMQGLGKHSGIEILRDASERQKRLPIACDERCLANIGMDAYFYAGTTEGDVGLKLMDIVGDRIIKYVPDPGFRGRDTITFSISVGTTESVILGTVNVDVLECGDSECRRELNVLDRSRFR